MVNSFYYTYWGKSDKMRGLPSILSISSNAFTKFNNSGARMLVTIYHMALKYMNFCYGVLV